MIESIQELLQKEAQAVLNIPVTDAYERAVELIVEQNVVAMFMAICPAFPIPEVTSFPFF